MIINWAANEISSFFDRRAYRAFFPSTLLSDTTARQLDLVLPVNQAHSRRGRHSVRVPRIETESGRDSPNLEFP